MQQLESLKTKLAEAKSQTAPHDDGDDAGESPDPETHATHIAELTTNIAQAEQRVAKLQAAVEKRRTWLFKDDQTQWWHDTLAGLVESLRTFVDADPHAGVLASVKQRLEFAKTVKERSMTGPEAATRWTKAINDIAQLDVYGGLELEPQIGLLPLHRDPQSGLWEFWHIQSGTMPEPAPVSGESPTSAWNITGETGLVFVLLPGGTFWMGAQKDDPEKPNYDPFASTDEDPVHQVTLDPFFISKYEMTQGQWLRFTGSNPSRYGMDFSWMGHPPAEHPVHENRPSNPVEEVSWWECDLVLSRLGLEFPTEAQWEYAARGGTATAWWVGNDEMAVGTAKAGNLADGGTKRKGGPNTWLYNDWLDDGWVVHAPVGCFAPNGFGLHDTIGNLWEWCRDELGDYEQDVAPGDGLRTGIDRSRRVHRGGGYSNIAELARSAYRNHLAPELRYHYLGVRPARSITAHESAVRVER